jgi:ribosome-binding factor A
MKKPHHVERFSSFIRDELAIFLQHELNCDEGVFVSVMSVEPAQSEGSVKVLVSVWPEEKRTAVAKKLRLLENKARAHLAKRLARKRIVTVHFYVIEASESF